MPGVFLRNFEDELIWGDGAGQNKVLKTKPDRNKGQLLQGHCLRAADTAGTSWLVGEWVTPAWLGWTSLSRPHCLLVLWPLLSKYQHAPWSTLEGFVLCWLPVPFLLCLTSNLDKKTKGRFALGSWSHMWAPAVLMRIAVKDRMWSAL